MCGQTRVEIRRTIRETTAIDNSEQSGTPQTGRAHATERNREDTRRWIGKPNKDTIAKITQHIRQASAHKHHQTAAWARQKTRARGRASRQEQRPAPHKADQFGSHGVSSSNPARTATAKLACAVLLAGNALDKLSGVNINYGDNMEHGGKRGEAVREAGR